MQNKKLLIVFVKNPIAGKVKTRLASSIGEQQALEVYKALLAHTLSISKLLETDKVVYYSDFISSSDSWTTSGFTQELQGGDDLGQKMMCAFNASFQQGYNSVVIIGSDCFELTTAILQTAFDELSKTDVIIGPAKDGGYYLLGMKTLYGELFRNKTWGSEILLSETLNNIKELKLSYSLLQELRDIDTEEDLVASSLSIQNAAL
jgi:rSAM/selenodomain-associated transferase 1